MMKTTEQLVNVILVTMECGDLEPEPQSDRLCSLVEASLKTLKQHIYMATCTRVSACSGVTSKAG